MEDEIFGPLFPIYRYSDLGTVTAFVNSGEKPLAMYVEKKRGEGKSLPCACLCGVWCAVC
jgi:aldehyde dehydrogenase (NAD+)